VNHLKTTNISIFNFAPFATYKSGSFAKRESKLKCFCFRGFNCITKSQKPLVSRFKTFKAGDLLKNNNNESKFILNCNESLPGTTNRSVLPCWSYRGDGCFSTGNRLRITFHLKIAMLMMKKSIGFGNIQKPYNGAVDLLIASKMDCSILLR
jgi:hypothetical protein